MARKDPRPEVNRRKFLAGVAVAGAATAVSPPQNAANAATTPTLPTGPGRAKPSALPPSGALAAAETGTPQALAKATRPDGSDFMVDVIKTLDIEYLPSNAASSFRGLHESLINYGGNKKPEFLTCTHEECAVAMGHGYFKVAGKPMMTLAHGTVGLQHACHGDLQRLVRPGAGHRRRRQRSRRRQAPARRADLPFGAGHQRAGARLHQVGRHAGLAAALRAVDGARLQDRDDAALRAGGDLARRRPAAGADQATARSSAIPRYVPTSPPQGDSGRGARSRAAARQCRASGDRGRSRRPHRPTASSSWSSSPSCCRRRWSTRARA